MKRKTPKPPKVTRAQRAAWLLLPDSMIAHGWAKKKGEAPVQQWTAACRNDRSFTRATKLEAIDIAVAWDLVGRAAWHKSVKR